MAKINIVKVRLDLKGMAVIAPEEMPNGSPFYEYGETVCLCDGKRIRRNSTLIHLVASTCSIVAFAFATRPSAKKVFS